MEQLDDLQVRVGRWVRSTFANEALIDRWERASRVVEEAIELGQAEGSCVIPKLQRKKAREDRK